MDTGSAASNKVSNKSQILAIDGNGGVSLIKTGNEIKISGHLTGPNAKSTDRLTKMAHAALGKIGSSVYEIA